MKPGTYERNHEHGGDRCRQAFRIRLSRHGGNRDRALADVRAMGCDYSPRGSSSSGDDNGYSKHPPSARRATVATYPPRRKPEAAPAARDAAWWL